MIQICLISPDESEKWQLEKLEIDYLYSYLFRFSNKCKLTFFESNITLSGSSLLIFSKYLLDALTDLIGDIYEKPLEKVISKHPTRYERFNFNDKKYVVDYTTSINGRLIYTLYLRIVFVTERIDKGESLILVFN